MDVVPSVIQMGKKAALVSITVTPSISKADADKSSKVADMAKKLAMHVAAVDPAPLYMRASEVPEDVIARETAIFRYRCVQCRFQHVNTPRILKSYVDKG
jgi:translation elongation factor EF-Ts